MSDIGGAHNENIVASAARVLKSNSFRDLSTVWVTPTPDRKLDAEVVFSSWMRMSMPMNQKVAKLGIANAEVGDAYQAAVEIILRDPIKWKYMLTVEHDNLPPPDGLLKLYESIDQFDAVGGLYWMKGENGTAMIYGDPAEPGTFYPQAPVPDTLQQCNGLGMGFTIFNVEMFRKLPPPWFQTRVDAALGDYSQDLFFFDKAGRAGYKFACDTRIKVGHMDLETRKIW